MRRKLHALVLSVLCIASACSTPKGDASKSGDAAADAGPVDWNVKPPPKETTGKPLRVKYYDFVSGHVFELVNESHTNPHELYSKKVPTAQAYTKVQTDEVLDALDARMKELGAYRHVQPGLAPALATGTRARALEIESAKGPTHWAIYPDTATAEREAFMQCAKDFRDLYNATNQWQAVQGKPEWEQAGDESARRQPTRTYDSRKLPASGGKP
jgi:hypothetical protein